MSTVQLITARAREAGPRCGEVTVIAIDGPAGSGKTTLARSLTKDGGAQLVHMDDLYPGWGGLRAAGTLVGEILCSLAAGQEATYRRYDWGAERYLEEHRIHPRGTLVIEGVGSVREQYRELLSLVVVVAETDPQERLRRGLRRDGPDARPHWERWMREEAALHEEVDLYRRADIVVDGHGRIFRS